MKIKVLIVEDNIILADEIKFSLIEMGYQVIDIVDNGQDAIDLVKDKDIDIILMDIKLKGGIDGIETAKKIKSLKHVLIIFLTDLNKKRVWEKAKVTNPSAYLIKPFNKLEIDAAFQIAIKNTSKKEANIDPKQDIGDLELTPFEANDRIYLREGTRFIRILKGDILYIKGAGSYSDIYTADKKHTLTYNLTQIKKKISFEELERVHKSYIININKITGFEGNRIFIDKVEIPIGGLYKEAFLKKIKFI